MVVGRGRVCACVGIPWAEGSIMGRCGSRGGTAAVGPGMQRWGGPAGLPRMETGVHALGARVWS